MMCLWNCVQFWLCCTVTLSFTQAMSGFLLLPPLFSVDQVLWLCCLIIPILSISMIATPMDPTIMQRATGKNQCTVNGQVRKDNYNNNKWIIYDYSNLLDSYQRN